VPAARRGGLVPGWPGWGERHRPALWPLAGDGRSLAAPRHPLRAALPALPALPGPPLPASPAGAAGDLDGLSRSRRSSPYGRRTRAWAKTSCHRLAAQGLRLSGAMSGRILRSARRHLRIEPRLGPVRRPRPHRPLTTLLSQLSGTSTFGSLGPAKTVQFPVHHCRRPAAPRRRRPNAWWRRTMFLDPKSNRERRDRSPPLHAERRSYAFSLPRQQTAKPRPHADRGAGG
jgi:hypothetical protein